jgi:hypothetical protein
MPLTDLCAGAILSATRDHNPQIPLSPLDLGKAFKGHSTEYLTPKEIFAAMRRLHRVIGRTVSVPLGMRCVFLHLGDRYRIPQTFLQESISLWETARKLPDLRSITDAHLAYTTVGSVLISHDQEDLWKTVRNGENRAFSTERRHLRMLHLAISRSSSEEKKV